MRKISDIPEVLAANHSVTEVLATLLVATELRAI